MDIQTWWEILGFSRNRVAECIDKFYPSEVNNFHRACQNKQDGEAHRIMHEAWFRNKDKGFGPDGWDILVDLVSNYPN